MSDDREAEKANTEMTVFKEFAAVCRQRLQPETATSQRPKLPDILCKLDDGSEVAFEMSECAGVTTNPQGSRKQPVSVQEVFRRTTDLDSALQSELFDAYKEGRIDNIVRCKDHFAIIKFDPAMPVRKCLASVPQAIQLLNELGPGSHPVGQHHILSIRCVPSGLSLGSSALPYISSTDEGFHVADNLLQIANTKVHNHYDGDAPIHLVLYSQTASVDDIALYKQLTEMLKANMGQFTRVWVYSLGEQAIAFDSATGD